MTVESYLKFPHQCKIFFSIDHKFGKNIWKTKICGEWLYSRVQCHLRWKWRPNLKSEDASTRKLDLTTQTLLSVTMADCASPALIGSATRGVAQPRWCMLEPTTADTCLLQNCLFRWNVPHKNSKWETPEGGVQLDVWLLLAVKMVKSWYRQKG